MYEHLKQSTPSRAYRTFPRVWTVQLQAGFGCPQPSLVHPPGDRSRPTAISTAHNLRSYTGRPFAANSHLDCPQPSAGDRPLCAQQAFRVHSLPGDHSSTINGDLDGSTARAAPAPGKLSCTHTKNHLNDQHLTFDARHLNIATSIVRAPLRLSTAT